MLKKSFSLSKRHFCLFLVSLLLTVAFSNLACQTASITKSNTLTLWITYNPQEYEIFKRIAEDFQKDYLNKTGKEVNLNLQRIPYDGLMPRLKYACLANATPDICRIDNAWPLTLAYGKSLVALDNLPNFKSTIDEMAKEYVPAAIESNIVEIKTDKGIWERHLYGIPDQTNCVALFWNKELFRQSAKELRDRGLDPERAPKDWEEFIKYAQILTIKDKKQYGFGMFNSLWWSMPFFNTFGAQFVKKDANGKYVCTIDEPAAQQALQFMTDLYKKHGVEAGAWRTGSINPEQGFLNGKYAMILSGPWNLKRFSNIDFGVSLVPEGPAGTSSNVGGQNLVIFKTCKDPEAALEFLRYFSSEEVQIRWSESLGQIPVNIRAFDKIDLSQRPQLATFMQQLKTARPSPKIPRMDVVEEKVVGPALQLAMQGDKSVEQALKDSAIEINRDFLPLLNK
ncbi:MAG: extracellular solute-binding protein [Acidobacteria bacterium]|nr:extracellular solute-binding protein [Acidobacteriota bacterium]